MFTGTNGDLFSVSKRRLPLRERERETGRLRNREGKRKKTVRERDQVKEKREGE